MASWTTVPDSSLEPGKPVRSIDILALRDNPVAIAEGASGAPRINAAALKIGVPERDWVLSMAPAASLGDIGTYAFLSDTTTTTTNPGSTRAGSSLRYSGVSRVQPANVAWVIVYMSTTPAGTWRAMGHAEGGTDSEGSSYYGGTLWLRIA